MAAILVIDDEKTLLKMYLLILERFGHDVSVAKNGREGLQMFESGDYDLIITDVVMPGVDGNLVASHIRNSQKPGVPIIGISGTPWWADIGEFNTVLSKPFEVETLLENIQQLTQLTISEQIRF